MAEKKTKPEDTCERFVAFLDIMGFKDRLQREGHEKVGEMLESLRPTIKLLNDSVMWQLELERRKRLNKEVFTPDDSLIFLVSFSDSTILISRNESRESLNELLRKIQLIFFQAISNGIPMKGAIAHGKMTADYNNSIYFGQPLIDAYELQNALQLYGVVLHHTVERRVSESILKNLNCLRYPVPMKSRKITHYLVDWTFDLFTGNEFPNMTIPDVINVFGSRLYNNVSGKPRIYVDNTLEFICEIAKNKIKLQEKKT